MDMVKHCSRRGSAFGAVCEPPAIAHEHRGCAKKMRELWLGASPYVRSHLLWRLLDDEELPSAWHSQLFEFVLQNWHTFRGSVVQFLGPDDEHVVIRALERYGDPSFPRSKKWAYLCSVACASNYPDAIRALLSIGLESNEPFTRQVAQTLVGRLAAN